MAMSQVSVPVLTAEEYFQLNPEGRTELIQGEVMPMSPSGNIHGRLASRLDRYVGAFIEEHGLGETYTADAGFILSRNPDTVRAPDVAFLSRERIPAEGLPEGFFPGPPDLAIEVVSPGDRWSEIEDKLREYLEAGTREVWIVDPKHRTVQVCTPPLERRTLQGADVLTTPLLPGVSLPLPTRVG